MLNYKFAITEIEIPGSREIVRRKTFGVDAPYHMLDYLSESCGNVQHVREIIENLQKVVSGQLKEYGSWGHDLTFITSYPEKSVVNYTHVHENEIIDSQIDIPTSWLLKLMEDWLQFLRKEEDGTDTIIRGVPIPPG